MMLSWGGSVEAEAIMLRSLRRRRLAETARKLKDKKELAKAKRTLTKFFGKMTELDPRGIEYSDRWGKYWR